MDHEISPNRAFTSAYLCHFNFSRKESSFNLGTAETKLLYTLHWVILDAADECSLQVSSHFKLNQINEVSGLSLIMCESSFVSC